MVSSDVTTALCRCGCGQPAPILAWTDRRRGHVAGQPARFILGHNGRGARQPRVEQTRSYRTVLGVRIHRARAERALGRPLPANAVVHHADGSKADDAPLVICENQAYHFLLHIRTRVVQAGGDPNTERICGRCKALKPFESFTPGSTICRACRNVQVHAKHGRGSGPRTGPRKKRRPQ